MAKNTTLSENTFKNPPSGFRGAPFWAWNTDLNEKELLWQIDRLKEMGFGGFFMHTRSGMSTEYLGKEFMGFVRASVEHAKKTDMLAYLYDEDRWSSGAAGGYVTKDNRFRQRTVCLSRKAPEEMGTECLAGERCPEHIATFDICFDENDRIEAYKKISSEDKARGEKWYAYVLLGSRSGWYNGYTYLDTMNPDAVDRFIEVTHEAYAREVGGEFGKSIPAIFTDEPNFGEIHLKEFARDGKDIAFPWTGNYAKTFAEKYGYDIAEKLPELVWNLSGDKPSTARYNYYAHASELFASSYCDRIGGWCEKHNIALTGHMLCEHGLFVQVNASGETMRPLMKFTVPGIDMLSNNVEFSTAKQTQSVVHQMGRKRMASEMYGVTGWDFDFRGHKFQGDWQAALGVTLRVPHLSWVSMRGSAKRDYPASIGYQSCWYKKYGYIENHFARLNTVLTRGKPCVNVAVIHPVESVWLENGVREHTSSKIKAMDERFLSLTEWLLRGHIDFDYISESILSELYSGSEGGFTVGEMKYRAVFVPPLETIRSTTVKALNEFIAKGGKVVFGGGCPECVDGALGSGAQKLYEAAQKVVFSEADILDALEEEREVSILSHNGERKKDMIYALRDDGGKKWLFAAHCDMPPRIDGRDCGRDELRIVVKGHYLPELYDTVNGEIKKVGYAFKNGGTVISTPCYTYDSFLFLLTPSEAHPAGENKQVTYSRVDEIQIPDFAEYDLSESNVAVLDMAEWSRDGETYMPREEILRIDKALRKELGYPMADGNDVQPWCIPAEQPREFVYLRFKINSQMQVDCKLGYERVEELWLNGEQVRICDDGYFTDKAIRTMQLPELKKGENVLIIKVPISGRISLENFYLLGDFGVEVSGSYACITQRKEKIAYGSVTREGLPFYGAEITYKIPVECEEGDLSVITDYYNGALIAVKLDGKEVGDIVLPPYELIVKNVSVGKHTLELTLYASRINTFGALHLCVPVTWHGPNMWYTDGNGWAYEYQLKDVGIMKKPVVRLKRK